MTEQPPIDMTVAAEVDQQGVLEFLTGDGKQHLPGYSRRREKLKIAQAYHGFKQAGAR
jgi:hypothetical protein